LAYALLAAGCLVLFLGLTWAVMQHRTEAWDTEVMLRLAQERRDWLTDMMKTLSIAGSGLVEFPLAILLLAGLLLRRRQPEARWYAVAVLSGWALYALAKLAVHRARPHVVTRLMHDAGWYSYPSGHAMLAPLVFGLGVIAWTAPWPSAPVRRVALSAAALIALGVGLSRVYLGLHYPTDVIGGLLLGTAWSCLWLLGWVRMKRAL
jgi:undecaprenyl-diphosphatase